MIWLVIAIAVGLGSFLIYWFAWRPKQIHHLAIVARIDFRNDGEDDGKYDARVRLFDQGLTASDKWWPLGKFPSLGDALVAIRRFHGERVTDDNLYAFFKHGRAEVFPLGRPYGGK